MKSSSRYLLASLLLLVGATTHAQKGDGTAPQEAPYIQDENEFDVLPESGTNLSEEDDALSIENEISGSAKPKSPKPQEAVNLNESKSDIKIEDELLLEEDQTVQPAQVPLAPAPEVVEVKPAPKTKSSNTVRRSAKGGVEYIQHPQAAKGLTTITKDGAYIYKTRESTKYTSSGAFRLGMIDAPRISAYDGTTFSQMYSAGQQPLLMFDFEWQPFTGFGRLGVQTGFGLMTANGSGRFANGDTRKAKEKYTFIAIPLNIGLVYRLAWKDRQWVAPYVSAGGSYLGVLELRDDGKTKPVGTPGVYGGGGLMFNISAMSKSTAFALNSEYGIKNLWVSLDARYLKTFNEDLDFSSAIIGGGVVVDY